MALHLTLTDMVKLLIEYDYPRVTIIYLSDIILDVD